MTLKASETGETKYIEYVLNNVICSSATSGSGQGGEPNENITLNFSAV